jgi:sigma-B regulation protein RsbU (phosphoserine phosphatase)
MTSLPQASESPASSGSSASPAPAASLDRSLEALQRQIDSLNEEVSALRCRDATLKFYMQRLDEEMRLAARLQQDFLPKKLPQIGRVHFHTLFRPAGYVSGDLYDVMRLDERHVGFYMADAVGHGMPAALLTMFMKNALLTKQITADGYRLLKPGQTMARLNESLVGQNLSYATFATAIYGHVNADTLEVTLARGGHPSPMLLGADGNMQMVGCEGSLLGIFPDEQYDDTTIRLSPSDRLFVYTDGIEVAFSDSDQIDARRWREELLARRELPTEALLAEFARHLDRESGSLAPKDDLTMIVIEVR